MSISIVIPFYNSEVFIDETLTSVLNQSYGDIEVICVNDGSTDKTLQKLLEWRKKDDRIFIIDKDNGGIETSLKASISFLRNKYTFLIGHDDKLSIDALEEAVIEFDRNSNFDAVRMRLILTYENGPEIAFEDNAGICSGYEALDKTVMFWHTHTFCLWKTEIFKRIEAITTGKLMNFDEVATRFLYSCCKQVSFCTGKYYYFQHSDSITHKLSLRLIDVYAVDFYIKKLLVDLNVYIDYQRDFEPYMLKRLNIACKVYFDLQKKGFKVSNNERKKINLLFNGIDFRYLRKYLRRKDWILASLVYFNFNSYFLYKYFKNIKQNI